MTRLSVNINKVALLRNSRNLGIPSVLRAAELSVAAGAHGITVHPRPDQRHIRPADVFELADYLIGFPNVEFNIEGNPFPEFLELVHRVKPAQVTLVPDAIDAPTSDRGWNLNEDAARLAPIAADFQRSGIRVSLFMDVETVDWNRARELGAARVELYTQPYAEAFAGPDAAKVLALYAAAAAGAQAAGLGVNAGHDLNLSNLGAFCSIPGILEVSIGHALIADALEIGIPAAVCAYLEVLATVRTDLNS
ncbi:MAG TPA: pyridoxine 5'-phosphate synthase [Gemmatimonadaceae bacterium]|nr:pyridoxine 5'-phosphate synthase [Gemmatimonadaceae bacterium]